MNRIHNALRMICDYTSTSSKDLQAYWKGLQWRWEILHWLLSLACLVSMLAALANFDGSEVPEWRYGITLNTLVSILTTVGQLTLAVPVTASLGQLKWTYFREYHPLADFDLIDEATRGPWGSIVLLWRKRERLLMVVASLLVLSIPIIGPLAQHAVTYTSAVRPESTGTIPTARILPYIFFVPGILPGANRAASKAVYEAVLASDKDIFQVDASCPSGNCTWPEYQSLAVCSHCANITTHLKEYNQNNVSMYLTNGIAVANSSLFHLVNSNLIPEDRNPSASSPHIAPPQQRLDSIAFPEWKGGRLLHLFAIRAKPNPIALGGKDVPPEATECILTYCVNTYTASIENGTLVEKVFKTFENKTAVPWMKPVILRPDAQGPVFGANAGDSYALWDILCQLFQGAVTLTAPPSDSLWAGGIGYKSTTPTLEAIYEASYYGNLGLGGIRSLPEMLDNVSQSLTKFIRMNSAKGETAIGTSYQIVTLVRVRWQWTAFQAFFLLASLGLLTLVMLDTNKEWMDAWKTNSLANMLFGLPKHEMTKAHSLRRIEELQASATEVQVKVVFRDRGWGMITGGGTEQGSTVQTQ